MKIIKGKHKIRKQKSILNQAEEIFLNGKQNFKITF